MQTATFTVSANFRVSAAFHRGLALEPALSVAIPGNGSAVYTLPDADEERAEALRAVLAEFFSPVTLSIVEEEAAEEQVTEEQVAEVEGSVGKVAEESVEEGALKVHELVADPDLFTSATSDPPAPETPEGVAALFSEGQEESVQEESVQGDDVQKNSTQEEVQSQTSGVEKLTGPAAALVLRGPNRRELVEQGHALLRLLPPGSFTAAKPATGWDGDDWCIFLTAFDQEAMAAALANYADTHLDHTNVTAFLRETGAGEGPVAEDLEETVNPEPEQSDEIVSVEAKPVVKQRRRRT